MPLHFAVEGTAVDTQQLGGFRFIATGCLQGLDDLLLLAEVGTVLLHS